MFLGHYGVAFAAKRATPRTSLGTLAFAAQFLDELWPILLLAGVEHARIVVGLMAANPIEFVSYPISHSLLMAVVWGAVIGTVYLRVTHNRRGAMVVALVVLSHWVLDVPMHGADLPLWPGPSPRMGWGAWRSVPLSIILDAGVFVAGLVAYLRATTARDRVGTWGLWAMIVVLVAIFLSGTVGPPPPSERALALSALGLWLFVPWAWWVDRHRAAATTPVLDARSASPAPAS